MNRMNSVISQDEDKFRIYNCEQLFRDVWNWYLEGTSTEEHIAARLEETIRKARAERPRSEAEVRHLRAYMRDYILDYHARFEESRRHFFMIDLYPQNDARFNLVLTPVAPGRETLTIDNRRHVATYRLPASCYYQSASPAARTCLIHQCWNWKAVEDRFIAFIAAESTLRRLPEVMIKSSRGVRDRFEPYEYCKSKVTIRPDGRDIDQMRETMTWLLWLDPIDRRIVWGRAAMKHCKRRAGEDGLTVPEAQGAWQAGLIGIAHRLNAARPTPWVPSSHRPSSGAPSRQPIPE